MDLRPRGTTWCGDRPELHIHLLLHIGHRTLSRVVALGHYVLDKGAENQLSQMNLTSRQSHFIPFDGSTAAEKPSTSSEGGPSSNRLEIIKP